MKFYKIEELREMEGKKFDKLYSKKLDVIKELDFDKEKYCSEEQDDMLEVLKNKIKETLDFMENEKCETWTEYNLTLEKLISEVIDFYEMSLLAGENHSRGVRLVFGDLQDAFKNLEIKVEDISDIR